ncbi:MAG: MCP four helix bundle domain-containing protein [Melioribacteraceae bacterium]|nr:MCP four helix bundle domain-containing protein [Melioribacteraceae bacterium]
MKLKGKILSGFIILVIMLTIAGGWSIYELDNVGLTINKILDENYKSINLSKRMTEDLERQDSGILLLMLGRWKEGREILSKADSSFNSNLNFAFNNITVPGEKVNLDNISASYSAYRNLWEKPIVDTDKEGNFDWYFNRMHKEFMKVKYAVQQLADLNDKTMYEIASAAEQRSNRAIMPGIIAVLSSILFTVIFVYFVNYYVVNPIVNITSRVKMFIEKNRPFTVEIETKDELLELAESIKKLCEYESARVNTK